MFLEPFQLPSISHWMFAPALVITEQGCEFYILDSKKHSFVFEVKLKIDFVFLMCN